jgi:hypothetical protein
MRYLGSGARFGGFVSKYQICVLDSPDMWTSFTNALTSEFFYIKAICGVSLGKEHNFEFMNVS